MPNKGGKGAIDWIFIFPVHKVAFRAFKLRNYFFFKHLLFFQMGNQQLDDNIFF